MFCVIEEVQLVASLRHVHHILAVQGIICHLPIDRFLYSQAIFIINESGCGVNARKRPPGWGPGGQGGKRCPDALLQRDFDDRL